MTRLDAFGGEIAGGGLARFLRDAGRDHLWGEIVVEIDDETSHLVIVDGGLAVRTSASGESSEEVLTRVIHRLLRAERGTWQARALSGVAGADGLRTVPLDRLVVEASLRRASRTKDAAEAERDLPRYDLLGPLSPRTAETRPSTPPAALAPTPAPAPTPEAPAPAAAPATPEPPRRVNHRLEIERKRLAGLGVEMAPSPKRRREDGAPLNPEDEAVRRARLEELRARRAEQVRYSLRAIPSTPAPTTAASAGFAEAAAPPPTRRRALRSLIRNLAADPEER